MISRKALLFYGALIFNLSVIYPCWSDSPLVLYTDFGLKDGAVSAMKGVAYGVSPKLIISDLSHEATGNLYEGAYRLFQVSSFWPKGTVFVTVIDPGVGTDRLSVVLKTKKNHYYVAPNNGLLTLVAESEGIEELRQIDETRNRLKGSEESYTFHGRDVFGYTGARLASGLIQFKEVGPQLSPEHLITLANPKAKIENHVMKGFIPVLDSQYGNVWTNIPLSFLKDLGIKVNETVHVRIFHQESLIADLTIPYKHTFGDVPQGSPLVYVNSLLNLSFALNLGDFASLYHIGYGLDWTVEISP